MLDDACHVRMPANLGVDDMDAAYNRRPNYDDFDLRKLNLKHAHSYLFLPANSTRSDGWAAAMHASQHPRHCSRYLLVKDDLSHCGLGWTARLHSTALLLAMRQSRVLMEVPLHANGSHSRWCTQPPFTLQCIYNPWTHCPMPTPSTIISHEEFCKNRTHHHNCHIGLLPHATAISLRLTTILRSTAWWQLAGARPGAQAVFAASHRALFGSPRKWVLDLVECTMRVAGLRPGRFQSIHVRLSPEKALEVAKSGKVLPETNSYCTMARAAAQVTGVRNVFVQTANPEALHNLTQQCGASLNISYTNNPRVEKDAWGGWVNDADVISQQTAVGAVNAQIAKQAAVFISPSTSIWTTFINYLMGADDGDFTAKSMLSTSYQCAPATRSRLKVGYLRLAAHKERLGDALFEKAWSGLPEAVRDIAGQNDGAAAAGTACRMVGAPRDSLSAH